jgi:Fur family zinc uptake transcriptional regulator
MAAQGLRITDQRKTLAGLFAESPGYRTPKDVYEYMGRIYPGLSFDTVYRNLRIMEELGVLEQVMFEEGVRFKLHCREHKHQCSKTYPIKHCPMDATDVPDNFQVVRHKFEVFGYCEDCRQDEAEQPSE